MSTFNYLFIFLFAFSSVYAQTEKPFTGTKNKKAENLFIEAVQLVAQGENRIAFMKLKDCIAKDSNFIDAWMLVADIREQNDQYKEATTIYKKVITINPNFAIPYFKLAKAAVSDGEYELAYDQIQKYKAVGGNQIEAGKVERVEKTAAYGMYAIKNPVPFDPKNLGANINSKLNEYFPGVSADDQTLIYTRLDLGRNEEFYMSKKTTDGWGASYNMGSPVNTSQNEGTISLSTDGQYIFFTGCNRPEGEGSCDLYFSLLDGDTWKQPQNLGFPINSRAWESQPSVSFDGKTLYFSSSRPGGFGESDIWYSTYNKGKWGPPVNLGNEINTPGSEQSPVIAKDDQTLYFISDYHPGMGGFDIFISRRQPDGRWGKAENIGYPINSFKDEMSIALTADGTVAYLATERSEGMGGLDIYSFELYEKARPKKTAFVKGIVFDARTLQKLKARIELIDIATSKTVIEASSNKLSGEFLFCLPADKNYALNVSAPNYLFYSENFALNEQPLTEPLLLNIPLNPIISGEKAVLRNVFFDVDKFDLKEESKLELNKLIELLRANPNMRIEVSGHTDNTGSKQKNLELSNYRAKSVVNYLIEKGVASNRLSYKGYADNQPIAENKTEKGRKQNRRTEFKILAL